MKQQNLKKKTSKSTRTAKSDNDCYHFPNQEVIALASAVGDFIQYWGFKKIHGQIWLLLYLCPRPISAMEIAKVLNVSKALVSFAVKDLLEYNVIEFAERGQKRTQYLKANPDIENVIVNVLKIRETKIIGNVLDLIERVPQINCVDAKRLESLKDMSQTASEFLQFLILSNLDTDNVKKE